jgi:hypothetical protein
MTPSCDDAKLVPQTPNLNFDEKRGLIRVMGQKDIITKLLNEYLSVQYLNSLHIHSHDVRGCRMYVLYILE